MCDFPITLKRGLFIGDVVPCGRCISCIESKRAGWSFRLNQELKDSITSTFLTLTYDENHLPKSGKLDKRDLQRYFKRVRKTTRKLRYYAVGEYGDENHRPHYHAIVFDADNSTLLYQWKDGEGEPKGRVSTDTVTEASIHYVTGYVGNKYGKLDPKTGKQTKGWSVDDIRPFSIMSKGLGKRYIKYATKYHKSNFTTQTIKEGGQKTNIPRYYRDKIFSESEIKELGRINRENYISNLPEYNKIIGKRKVKTVNANKSLKNRKI